jgi:two-component system cell cycle sensor histidine kinase/response regulator CckA
MNILYIEDDPLDFELVQRALKPHWPDCRVKQANSLVELSLALKSDRFDLVLSDFNLPGFDGHTALRIVREFSPSVPVVFVSGAMADDTAVELVRAGASDYVLKDRLDRLAVVIPRALKENEDRRRRMRAEEDLRSSEERFRSIFLTMADGILLLDDDNRIVSANPSAQRLIGIDSTELIGATPVWRAVHDDLRPFAPEELPWAKARETGRSISDVVMGLHQPSGSLVWVLAYARRLEHRMGGNLRPLMVTFHDITALKSVEERIARTHHIESLGLLATGIAHDLNNIVAPWLMGVALLRERGAEAPDESLLALLEKSATRGAELARQILTFAKGPEAEKSAVALNEVAANLVGFLKATLPNSIQLENVFDPQTWPVQGNSAQLQHAILILCIIARESMPGGGALRLMCTNVRLNAAATMRLSGVPTGSYVRFEIADTGRGISPETLSQIWEPYRPARGSSDQGVGLRLSTVRRIIQNHAGYFDVQSEVGAGTTYTILIPANEQRTADAETPALPSSHRGDGACVLLVDDDPLVCEMIAQALTVHGYRVIVAADGTQAYSRLLQHGETIQMLIADVDMPKLDGLALAAIARRQFAQTKIILMSGHGAPAKKLEAFTDCSDAFLPKPFAPELLFRTLAELRRKPTDLAREPGS